MGSVDDSGSVNERYRAALAIGFIAGSTEQSLNLTLTHHREHTGRTPAALPHGTARAPCIHMCQQWCFPAASPRPIGSLPLTGAITRARETLSAGAQHRLIRSAAGTLRLTSRCIHTEGHLLHLHSSEIYEAHGVAIDDDILWLLNETKRYSKRH